MSSALITDAKVTEDVATALQLWLEHVPKYATDISGSISELFGISSALRALDNALDPKNHGNAFARIQKQLPLVRDTLRLTLYTIRRMYSTLAAVNEPNPKIYKSLWEDVCAQFKVEGPSLCTRLEWFRVYVNGLFDVLRG